MDHPTPEDLKRLSNGDLPDDRFEEVAAHVDSCPECCAELEKTGAFPELLKTADATEVESGKALAAGVGAAGSPDDSPTASALSLSGINEGSVVGPYKLLQQLGEGGMGVVYMAEQEKPVRRMVALKIIKPGMDSQQVIARFEAERQALAMMDHHHIAKVLDAGTTDTGRPYFAMELVKGVPITEYCDRNKLTPRDRLEMFVPVCHAIQHAHQKGIIHRDIKPSNVLVTLYDGKPVPKVIDFGIAKAIQQKLTERTMFTGIGQILGTLEYMSPEQAEMNQLDIDTRSDVYSLGVMLYELLTGSTPISKEKLRNVGLEEMLRTIRETEPSKPSTRLSDSGEALPSISAVRKTEPAKLSKLVRGDLDWIVMKALEKDRTRRYETASGLASDIDRFLKDEAVEACPPSASYKFRKFARRNKATIATVTTIAGILLVSTVLSSWLAYKAFKAEGIATAKEQEATAALVAETKAKGEAERQRKLANENATKANREATKSREVATFLKDMLNGVGPSAALGRDTKMLREILENTEQRIGSDLSKHPEVEADVRTTISDVYRELGEMKKAETHLLRAKEIWTNTRGAESTYVGDTLWRLATCLPAGASKTETFRESVRILSASEDGEHPRLPTAVAGLSETIADATPWELRLGDEQKKKQAEAELLARQAVDLAGKIHGRVSEQYAECLFNLSYVIWKVRPNDPEGMELSKQVVEILAEGVEANDLVLSNPRNSLAAAYYSRGRLAEAEQLFKTISQQRVQMVGPARSVVAWRNMTIAMMGQAKFEECDNACNSMIRDLQAEMASSDKSRADDRTIQNVLRRVHDVRGAIQWARGNLDASLQHFRMGHGSAFNHSCFRENVLGHYAIGNAEGVSNAITEYNKALSRRLDNCMVYDESPSALRHHEAIATLAADGDWEQVEQKLDSVSFAQLGHRQQASNLVEQGKLLAGAGRLVVRQESFKDRIDQCAKWYCQSHKREELTPMYQAALYTWFGMREEHSGLCSALLQEPELSTSELEANPGLISDPAKAYLLSSFAERGELLQNASDNAHRAWELSRSHLYRGWYALTSGLAYYRSGELETARDRLQFALAKNDANFYLTKEIAADLLLAMVHHRLGEDEEAITLFRKAERVLPHGKPPGHEIVDAYRVLAYDQNTVICWLLYEEAQELLEAESSEEPLE